MNGRKLWIIGIQEKFLEIVTKQVKVILDDQITIDAVTVKDLQKNMVGSNDVVVISSNHIRGLIAHLIPETCPIIVGKRDINYINTKKLLNLPPGQKILIVNDTEENTNETVSSLKKTIFEHEYIAYEPEKSIPVHIDYIVTPGESHLLPQDLTNVIDIGHRILNFHTLKQIFTVFGLDFENCNLVGRYFKSCVSVLENDNMKKAIYVKDARNIAQYTFEDIISESKAIQQAITEAENFAKDEQVQVILIEGEQGSGKNMIAQAIHNRSSRANLPFITIDCRNKDIDLLERELFGSAEGELSYGVFELVMGGTVCIREVEELPPDLQAKMLKILKEGSFCRIGGKERVPITARLITTISTDAQIAEQETLLSEFYQLLALHKVKVPALRERSEDIVPLIEEIKRRLNRELQLSEEVTRYFSTYPWPGNVRELYNVITYLSTKQEGVIEINSLPFFLRKDSQNDYLSMFDECHSIIQNLENRGFLNESIEILTVFKEGKETFHSFGRKALKQHLEEKGLRFSEQQLRIRLEELQKLGLTIVRQGRAGSTISPKGEAFLKNYLKMVKNEQNMQSIVRNR
ncbi:MAG: sigma 54-interacting transcriptional regulator [Caldibacillus thermoamylovorans]